ncbi:MAG TPA: hypothetical protein VL576_00380 [Candidatus Paceibacterota bacterium]|jgi:hypothetical protein|nr:hypothetical protein [Candidatus Paceibacterota bacterium]
MEVIISSGILFLIGYVVVAIVSVYYFFECWRVRDPYGVYLHIEEDDDQGVELTIFGTLWFLFAGIFFVAGMNCVHACNSVQEAVQLYLVISIFIYILTYLRAGSHRYRLNSFKEAGESNILRIISRAIKDIVVKNEVTA